MVLVHQSNLLCSLLFRTLGASISNAAENVVSSSKAQTIKENVLLFEDILEDLQAGLRCHITVINCSQQLSDSFTKVCFLDLNSKSTESSVFSRKNLCMHHDHY
jgi:hypothetical protein